MRKAFPAFPNRSNWDFVDIMRQALFVFDTNVLLNFYRHGVAEREELLVIMEAIASQVWIPHQVALEFYRNRPGVMVDQHTQVSAVRKEAATARVTMEQAVKSTVHRYSWIDTSKFVAKVGEAADEFRAYLDDLEKRLPTTSSPDPVLERIERIFDNRVGPPPRSQDDLDKVFKEAEARAEKEFPPGFMDVKNKDKAGTYSHQGLVYQRRFGDFVWWRQTLDHVQAAEIKKLVLVTDDSKRDWWQIESGRTIGPRYELVDEMSRSGVQEFLMYSPQQFWRFASTYRQAALSTSTMTQVEAISSGGENTPVEGFETIAAKAAEEWLATQHWPLQKDPTSWSYLSSDGTTAIEILPMHVTGPGLLVWGKLLLETSLENRTALRRLAPRQIIVIVMQSAWDVEPLQGILADLPKRDSRSFMLGFLDGSPPAFKPYVSYPAT